MDTLHILMTDSPDWEERDQRMFVYRELQPSDEQINMWTDQAGNQTKTKFIKYEKQFA